MNLKQLLQYQYSIIYGDGDKKTLYNKILTAYPQYTVKLSAAFFPKKVGPLTIKVKKTMYDLLAEDSYIFALDHHIQYLNQAIKALELKELQNRFPPSLSYGQRERFSIVLDVARKKREFLFYHEGITHDMGQFILYLKWFSTLTTDHKLIFITNEPKENIIMMLKEHHLEDLCVTFEYQNNELTLTELFKPLNQEQKVVEKEMDYYNADISLNNEGLWMNIVMMNKDNLKVGKNILKLTEYVTKQDYEYILAMDEDFGFYQLDDAKDIIELIKSSYKEFLVRVDSEHPCIILSGLLEFFHECNIITEKQYSKYCLQLKPFLNKEKNQTDEELPEFEELELSDEEIEEEYDKIVNESKLTMETMFTSSQDNEPTPCEDIVINEDELDFIYVYWLNTWSEAQSFGTVDNEEEIYVPNTCIPFDPIFLEPGVEYKLYLYNNKPYKISEITESNDLEDSQSDEISFEVSPVITHKLLNTKLLEWLESITHSYNITDIFFTTEDNHIFHLLSKEDIKDFANSVHYKATLTVRGKDCIDAAGSFINEIFYKGVIGMSTYTKCLGIVQQAAKK